MAHSPDDLAFLTQLQAEHPEQAALIRGFARQNGLPVPPVPATPTAWPTPPGAAIPEHRDASFPTAAWAADGVAARRWQEHLDPEPYASTDATLPSLPPSAAQFHTGAPLQGAELMGAVVARRRALGMTQAVFAARLGVSMRTYQEWEQGRRRPSGPAEAMLRWQL
ncbi:helix-turn-helix domain-containing protein [Halomonas sp.]|uniref:helix-turn-helix domain-containing protein n=1 Tax=Halomonas sp. TaxID=1486246 RepID=UPI003A0FDC47